MNKAEEAREAAYDAMAPAIQNALNSIGAVARCGICAMVMGDLHPTVIRYLKQEGFDVREQFNDSAFPVCTVTW